MQIFYILFFKIVRPHIEALIPYRDGAGELYFILKYCLSGQTSMWTNMDRPVG